MRNDQKFNLEFMEIIKLIKKKYYIMLLVTIPITLLSIYYGLFKQRPIIYEAKSSIIIGNPIDNAGTQFRIDDVARVQSYMNTYSAIIRTTAVTEKTVQKLGLNISPEGLKNSIVATPQANTQFMDLRVTWDSPDKAIEILNVLTEVFIEEAKSIYPTVNIKVMEKAERARALNTSTKEIYLLIGPIAGIIISILIIFGIELFDNTIRTEEDVQAYLDVPVIGVIPKEKRKINEINAEVIKNLNPVMVEACRTLRTNIYFTSATKNVKSIVVTSSRPDEGKSTTAAMLAAVIAQAGKKTILIDCDLRKSNVHKLFNYDNMLGIFNIIINDVNWVKALHKTDIDNLFVLTAGIRPPNPAEFISSEKMKSLIEELGQCFDYIIIDAPPVGIVTDAQILSQFTDGCLLVVASGEVVRKETVKAKELIQQVNGRILGVSLNKVKDFGFNKYYHYYNEPVKSAFWRK